MGNCLRKKSQEANQRVEIAQPPAGFSVGGDGIRVPNQSRTSAAVKKKKTSSFSLDILRGIFLYLMCFFQLMFSASMQLMLFSFVAAENRCQDYRCGYQNREWKTTASSSQKGINFWN